MRSKRSRSRQNLSFRPGKHPLDRPEALFENGRLEDRLAAPLRLLSAAGIGVDVGNHAAVEDRLESLRYAANRTLLFRRSYAIIYAPVDSHRNPQPVA